MYLGFQNTTRTFPTFRSPGLMSFDFHFFGVYIMFLLLCVSNFVLIVFPFEMYISWKKTGAEAGNFPKIANLPPQPLPPPPPPHTHLTIKLGWVFWEVKSYSKWAIMYSFWVFFPHNENQEFELLKYSGAFAV